MNIVTILSALTLLATAAPAETLAEAACSPYTLARWFDTHSTSSPDDLKRTFNIKDENATPIPVCEEPGACVARLIEVPDPRQVIVVIEHRRSMFQIYARFKPATSERWRLTKAYAPNVKYFLPSARLDHIGSVPFLIIREQGGSGSWTVRRT